MNIWEFFFFYMTRKNWVWLVKLVSHVESLNCLFKKGLNKEVKTCKQAGASVKRKKKRKNYIFWCRFFFLSSGGYDPDQITGDFSFFWLPQIFSTNEGRIVKGDIFDHLGWTGSVRGSQEFLWCLFCLVWSVADFTYGGICKVLLVFKLNFLLFVILAIS